MSRHEPEVPPRPYLPPVLAGAASCVAASALLMDASWRSFTTGSPRTPMFLTVAAAGIVALSAGIFALSSGGRGPRVGRYLFFAGAGALVAVASCHHAAASRDAAAAMLEGRAASTLQIEVSGDPSKGDRGWRVEGTARSDAGEAGVELGLDEPAEAGEVLVCVGGIDRVEEGDWGRSLYMAGSVAEIDAVAVTERSAAPRGAIGRLRDAALDAIDPAAGPERALVAGIVCGRTTELNQSDAAEAFAATGTSHLVAVSGGHLALVSAAAIAVLGAAGLGPAPRAAAVLALLCGYVLFAGASASAVRSLAMVAPALAAQVAGRRPHAVSTLSIAVGCMVALDPGVVYDLGFQLSAASVLFISLFFSLLSCAISATGAPRWAADGLSLTLCAQWATLPVTLPVFGELSLVAPVANLVLGPVMGALLAAGCAGAAACAVLPASIALAPADALARASIFMARVLARVPFASLPVDIGERAAPLAIASAALAAAVLALWRVPRPRTVAIAAAVPALAFSLHVARWSLAAPPSVVIMDVGQGDSILIRDGSHALIVDCGVDDAVRSAIARNSIFGLDAVVVTHWDLDHWGGLADLVETARVPRLLVPRGAEGLLPEGYAETGAPAPEPLDAGDVIRVGRFSCEVVWPREEVYESENGDSLVLLVEFEGTSGELRALLTGDTEVGEEASYAPLVGRVDVLKLGHHGSSESVDGEVLDELDPAVCVASAGEGNRYGHPSSEAVSAVEAHGSEFLCTIESGDVVVEPASGGARVRGSR